VHSGRLSACPGSPNCVSSQSEEPRSQIDPILFRGDPTKAMEKLRQVIEGMGRTRVVEAHSNYLYAEFESRLLGFVDDFEAYCEAAESVIHVRSASRLGHSDFGVNRKRVEEIRRRFASG
jgi:uncharacterized protein (DUF1499 family)